MGPHGGTPPVSPALSCVELLVGLYYSVLRIDPQHPDSPGRDRFLLSKGHACMAQYATLCERGSFPRHLLDQYAADGAIFRRHFPMTAGASARSGRSLA